METGAAASLAATNKTNKYSQLSTTVNSHLHSSGH